MFYRNILLELEKWSMLSDRKPLIIRGARQVGKTTAVNLNTIYNGAMIEHLVGQELLATQYSALNTLHFWVREKKTSTAEVDYIPF